MFRARLGKGIVVRTSNKIGALADFATIVVDKSVSILAMSAWVEDAEAVIRLICEDVPSTMEILRDNGYDVQEREVVLVDAQHQPGILCDLAKRLAGENIDITHLFASTIDKSECVAVLNSSDNERAIELLNR